MDRLEKYRNSRLRSNPIKIDMIDMMIKKLLAPESSWIEKLVSTIQIALAWVFIGLRAKLLSDEMEYKKAEFNQDLNDQAHDNINNGFDLND